MYHAVVPAPLAVFDTCFLDASAFADQIEHLARHHDVVPLSRTPQLLQQRVGRPSVAVTFDDGFLNNFEVAFPVLERAGVPATIFLCTDLIDTDDTIWFCRVNQALAESHLSTLEWRGKQYELRDAQARATTSAEIQARLKQGSQRELIDGLQEVVGLLGGDPEQELGTRSPYRMLTSSAVRELARSPLIEFGAHTRDHSILGRLVGTQRRDQIDGSIQRVAELTGRPCRLFAYPNGGREDYDQECVELLRRAGVELAVTAIPGLSDSRTPLLELRRDGVWGDIRADDFRSLVDGPGLSAG
jgi:peptidoglycan/xylan/chitin deacetylase (PgdA/CDA1 family)